MATRVLEAAQGWTVGTYLQWLPIVVVTLGVVAGYVKLGDRVDSLEKAQPATSIAVDLTIMRDRIDAIERAEAKLETKQGADYADLRAQIWRRTNAGPP